MTMYNFRLEERDRTVPNDGETVGKALSDAADLLLASYESRDGHKAYYRPIVARIYRLAADAYEIGAARSIGHNRTERYMQRVKELTAKAVELEGEPTK